jgi:hypothetical protein
MPSAKELLRSRLLLVHGTWQREGDVKNLIAGKLEDLTPMLGRLATESRDFESSCEPVAGDAAIDVPIQSSTHA